MVEGPAQQGRNGLAGVRFGREYLARIGLFSRQVRLFLAGLFLAGLGLSFWQLLFNLYLQQRGWNKELIGHALSATNLAVAVAAVPAGLLAGRVRLRRLVVLTLPASAAALAASMLAGRPSLLIGLAFAGFALFTFVRVVTGPFVMRHTSPVERPYVFSTVFIVMLAGGVGGNLAAGLLTSAFTAAGLDPVGAYRATILTGLGCSLLGALPFLMIRDEPPPAGTVRSAAKGLSEWPLFVRALLPQACLAVGAGLIVQFMNLYLRDVFAMDDRRIGLWSAVQAATMVFGVLVAPSLAERLGTVRTIVATQFVSMPFMLLLGFTRQLPLAVAALVVRAALMNMSAPLAQSLTLSLVRPESQGMLNACSVLVWSVAWAFAAWLYGSVLAADYTACFVIATGLYAVSSGLFWRFFRRSEG